MNLKRFTARTSRDALALVRQAFGDDAVVMSTRPCAEGVEVLAMAPESVAQIERFGASQPLARPAAPAADARPAPRPEPRQAARADTLPEPRNLPRTEPRNDGRQPARAEVRQEPALDADVAQDIEQLQMSTLSFQDYVRQRMLKRREAARAAELAADAAGEPEAQRPLPPGVAPIEAARSRYAAARQATRPSASEAVSEALREVPVLRDEVCMPVPQPQPQPKPVATLAAVPTLAPRTGQGEMLSELRSMRGLIEQRFGALAFMEKLQRQPRQAQLAQRLLEIGFSPALIRKLVESLPADTEEMQWAGSVLERNLVTGERDATLEDEGGIFALIGATGVGKTTSTAKLAAAFATRHGAANLGLITLDAYRVAAHEQLRTYGRILGVPVHTAHDRASLEDLLDLLSAKRMVLIDTAGMAQRDTRTRELLEMLSHRAIRRLLVVNASAQGETIEDQLGAYGGSSCHGVVLSKLDEAVKLGPALDSMIRHRLKVLAVANGQRVPEDWHRLSANALVQRAFKCGGGPAWRLDAGDVNLIFAGLPGVAGAATAAAAF
ncbi:Flagellar biosynthesis protein FlhF [Rubrivivax sp. A210]|uniref:flagellar biosynthesis protein FlhF n=1 Tax=Rubrivivax sp. A210 TaxID=2772301 RepID=UPI00191A3272|nr:flagellar biosynthesis protein FlhF [Rubrivivax sp. A210]CAD5374756.1 Flagellar biosynthesis protein FlhF [Rubrivivax sp. A210]